ncbi:MAG: class I tRNA ligase family protein, partial [Phycisphaerales bacterium]|nr:class I tRNA ligase family protein [Phycisphaerales bacterium]
TAYSIRAVARVIREKGADAWFTDEPAELLRYYDPFSDSQLPKDVAAAFPSLMAGFRQGPDILDVWFESGSSWNSTMRERGLGYPVDLYLEGSDQHRGWFQLSLLPALGVTGKPPFKTLLTHGFMVDKDGKKLSKSKGDTVEGLMTKYGADVMRWWVSSLAYENDVKVDESYFNAAGESYRKVRNTLRFMLSNLYDFVPTCESRGGADASPGHCVDLASLSPTSLDAWVLAEFDTLSATVIDAYDRYDFRTAHLALFDFVNTTLSAVYCAAIKDRLYCDAPNSPRRRATQTVLWELTDGLCRLLAPILCHTADEAYRALWKVGEAGSTAPADACVHLKGFVSTEGKPGFGVKADAAWSAVFAVREAAMVAIEAAKKSLGVDNPLDMGVTLPVPSDVAHAAACGRMDTNELADLFGVSRVTWGAGGTSVTVADLRSEPLCERSRKRDVTVKPRAKAGGAMLSDRDAVVVGAV